MRRSTLALLVAPAIAVAQPATVSYQGRLMDSQGAFVSGPVDIQFAIHDSATGGTPIWCEQRKNVGLTDGYYALLLGEGVACDSPTPVSLAQAFAGADRYLEIGVNGAALSPRQRIASVPYAFTAASLPDGTGPFQGTGTVSTSSTSNQTAVVGTGTLFGTEILVGDLITINGQSQHVTAIADATHLTVDGNWGSTTAGLTFQVQKALMRLRPYSSAATPPAPALAINEKGNVGIGTSNPRSRLEVADGAVQIGRSAGPIYENWWEFGLDDGKTGTGIDFHGGSSTPYTDYAARIYRPPGNNNDFLIVNRGGAIQLQTDDTSRVTILEGGKVGIGTPSPAAPLGIAGYLHVSGSTAPAVPNQGAYLSWNITNGGGETDFINQRGGGSGGFNFYNATRDGTIGAAIATIDAKGVYTPSDERIKDVSGKFRRGLSAIRRLAPITFRWKSDTGFGSEHEQVGFSAQNVRESIPEAVQEAPDGTLTLTDRPIVSTLVNAVHELEEQNDALRRQNSALESRLKALEDKVAKEAAK